MNLLGSHKATLLALTLVVALPRGAAADAPSREVGRETIVIHGTAPTRGGVRDLDGAGRAARDRHRALGDTPLVTVLHPDEHLGEEPGLVSVLGGAVGTAVRSLGGLGAFASISVRGAASGHTAILVDGVPLARVGTVSADLGRFDLGAYDQIDLYRGAVPLDVAGAGVGGALALSTALGPTAQGDALVLSAGTGSFAARHLRGRWGGLLRDGDLAAVVLAGYRGARGDFRYFDDGGTSLDPSDDGTRVRTNNGFDEADLAARIGTTGTPARHGVLGVRVTGKTQGVPGPATTSAAAATLTTWAGLVDGELGLPLSETVAARVRSYLSLETQRYADPDDEIGVGTQDRRYDLGTFALSAAWDVVAGARRQHRFGAAVDGSAEVYRDHDLVGDRGVQQGDRLSAGVALGGALAFADDRVVLEPGLRFDAVRTAAPADAIAPATAMPPTPRWDLPASPRLGARAMVRDDVTVKASAGLYARLPTAMELFGDRGFIVGSPDLRAEGGPAIEAGAVWAPAAPRGPVDRILVEAAGFASWPHDTIALVAVGGSVARPINVGDAELRGVEASATARLARRLTVAGNYTLLHTAQHSAEPSFDGKALPRQPAHAASVRADLALRLGDHLVAPWAELEWQAASYLDQAQLRQVPGRTIAALGARVELSPQLLLGVDVRNLTDARVAQLPLARPPRPDLTSVPMAVADVAGYPLPGRALYLSITYRQ